MKTNQIEKILKKYLSAIKGSAYYVSRSEEWAYICDGCSILKFKTTKLVEMKESPLPEVRENETLQYNQNTKKFEESTVEFSTFEKYFTDAEENSENILIDTGFTKKSCKSNYTILRIAQERHDGDFYLLNEKYFKIIEMFVEMANANIYCTESNVKPCFCADTFHESKSIEFLALPCRISNGFFQPLKGIDDLY